MFSEDERRIYQFQSPEGHIVHCDPTRIHRRLYQATKGMLTTYLTAFQRLYPPPPEEGQEPIEPCPAGTEAYAEALDAEGHLAQAAIFAFELPPFEDWTGQGTLEREAIYLLAVYLQWANKKKQPGVTSSL